jgi:uroporphyrinogen III methyltransferase/synthase
MNKRMAEFVERIGPFPAGTVSIVGTGPGDPGLVSVRGAVRLCQADVISYGGGQRPVELLRLCQPEAQFIFSGKRSDGTKMPVDKLVSLLGEKLAEGKRVVRLKGGNPFVFEHGEEEVRSLFEAGIPFEIVPAPTSGIAAATYAGVLITDAACSDAICLAVGKRSRRAGVTDPDFAAMARTGTLAVYLAEDNLDDFSQQLLSAGLPGETPAAIIERGTRPQQRVLKGRLDNIAETARRKSLVAPATLYVGESVRSAGQLNWFERRPLFGRRIINTRPASQSAGLTGLLASNGAEVIEVPAVEVRPLEDYAAMDSSIGRLGEFDWLVLTSANGVDALVGRLQHLQLDARALAGVKVAAIGPATSDRLGAHFIVPDLVPEAYVAEALAESMAARGMRGCRCLLLRSHIARRALVQQLAAAGAECEDVAAYHTVCPGAVPDEVVADLESGSIDAITFTSSSTFTNFVAMLGEAANDLLGRVALASIGPITSATMRSAGFEPALEAATYTTAGLARAVVEYYRRQG